MSDPSSYKEAEDPQYGGQGKRICIACGLRKELGCFRVQKDGVPFKRCIRCEEERKASKVAETATTAMTSLSKHLAAAMTRRREEQPHLGDAMALVMKRLKYLRPPDDPMATPMEVYSNLVAEEINRVFDEDLEPSKFTMNLRSRYIAMMNASLATLLRNDEGFKPEEMDREEVRDSLKALGVEEVRNDPELLKLLLREQGIEIVEPAEAEHG